MLKKYLPNNPYKYIVTIFVPVFLICIYGKFRCTHKKFKDPLETQLFLGLDGWSATHFCFFYLLGHLYPNTFYLSLTIGIAWELFEHLYGKHRPGWLGGYGDCNDLTTDKEGGNWWYGKWSDIGCNAVGFIMGRYLATMI